MSAQPGSLRLRRRIEYASESFAAIAATLVLGLAGVFVLALLVAGLVLSVIWIGLPLVLAALAACQALAEAHRRAANRLLNAHLAPLPAYERRAGDSLTQRVSHALADRRRWRVLALTALELPLALVLLVLALTPITLSAELLVLGVSAIAGLGEAEYLGPLALQPPAGVLLLALGLACAVLAVAILGGLRIVLRAYARRWLGRRGQEGPIRELLAERVGDRTLSIAYWLPDRETFVDERGRPVTLPEAGSGRAWTAVEHDGQRVAAIIHDAELDATPELVNAAASAAALALDNERLKADLRARVQDLRVSRARIVEAADAARRRLERDLHDGAQQQLVSLALDLRILRAKLKDSDEVLPMIDEISEKLTVALAELRELARGIHPAILTDRGLGPAVQSLADRVPVPVPVECDVELPDRPPPPVEAAAYFVVAEALTNVARYAKAQEARVDIRRSGGHVVVRVDDDGVGGADPEAGTGLRGLFDRVAALDGQLEIHSPRGQGTRLRARIPWEAAEPVVDEEGERRVRSP